jgi:hypothetical protein
VVFKLQVWLVLPLNVLPVRPVPAVRVPIDEYEIAALVAVTAVVISVAVDNTDDVVTSRVTGL